MEIVSKAQPAVGGVTLIVWRTWPAFRGMMAQVGGWAHVSFAGVTGAMGGWNRLWKG